MLETDHTSEMVRTVLSNHVSSLLAQQNHVVHLRNDIKIASTEINPPRACSNNSLRSDMALIFLQPEGSQIFRSAHFFMNIERGRQSINHGVAYKGSSLSRVIENQYFNEALPIFADLTQDRMDLGFSSPGQSWERLFSYLFD